MTPNDLEALGGLAPPMRASLRSLSITTLVGLAAADPAAIARATGLSRPAALRLQARALALHEAATLAGVRPEVLVTLGIRSLADLADADPLTCASIPLAADVINRARDRLPPMRVVLQPGIRVACIRQGHQTIATVPVRVLRRKVSDDLLADGRDAVLLTLDRDEALVQYDGVRSWAPLYETSGSSERRARVADLRTRVELPLAGALVQTARRLQRRLFRRARGR